MKIFVAGTRGIPDIPGGVEKHCQELYPLIVLAGHDVILATRKSYVQHEKPQWKGVQLRHIFAPHKKCLEAIVHTFLSVLKARWIDADIIHIHAIGPGLMVPLARILGLNVVVTNHGPDYERSKWGWTSKLILRLGEYLSGRFANEVIVISPVIADIVNKRCKRFTHLIYNGVPLLRISYSTNFLESIDIKPDNYLLAIARFVPEKGLHDLIKAFKMFDGNFKLVIAGDADHETKYSRALRKQAGLDNRVVLTGYIGGEKLSQVFSHAKLFVLPSYHEGLPIALLEAISYNLPVLVSDIPANNEIGLSSKSYFSCGDINQLKEKIECFVKNDHSKKELLNAQLLRSGKYDWIKIADQTITVYKKILQNRT